MAGVIPTLFVNQLEISSPADTLAYLLRFLFNNPGWTSSQMNLVYYLYVNLFLRIQRI